MRKRQRRTTMFLASCLAVLCGPASAELRSRGTYLELLDVAKTTRAKSNVVGWYWEPAYPAGAAELGVYVRCQQSDANGVPSGDNKITIKNLEIASINGTLVARFPKASLPLENGDTGWGRYGAQGMEPLVAEGPASAVAVLQVGRKIKKDHSLRCDIDVSETVPFGTSSDSARSNGARLIGTGRLLPTQIR